MSRVFILGATGGVGSRLATQLVARGDEVVGLHRRPEQAAALRQRGIEPFAGDLTEVPAQALAAGMAGADAIVFAAGAGSGGPREADEVDLGGVELATRAAKAAGVSRFLLVSAFPDAWRDQRMPPAFEHYMKVKRQADVHLAGTDLDWVIVRPGTLNNAQGTGCVRLGAAIPYDEVPRDDVAGVLAELVRATAIRRVILELTRGTTPISQAVAIAEQHGASGMQQDHQLAATNSGERHQQ